MDRSVSFGTPRHRVGLLLCCVLTAAAGLFLSPTARGQATAGAPPRVRPLAAAAALACPPSPVPGAGPSFRGQTLVNSSFAYQNLRNADFSGALLDGAIFVGADLTGANFSGARFVNGGQSPARPVDFMRANLTSACFVDATFEALQAPTYFTNATITGTDFSCSDVSAPCASMGAGNAVFGPLPLTFDITVARPRFQGVKMSCEVVAGWRSMDLTQARGLTACADQLKGINLSKTILTGVDLSGLDLSGTTWTGATLRGVNFQGSKLQNVTGLGGPGVVALLSGALFNKATIIGVDFSNAQLYGANFTNANVLNSSFQGAVLSADPSQTGATAATFTGAHLKNVNMSSTDLTGVNFNYASLYGHYGGVSPPTSSGCNLKTQSCGVPTGYTCDCASLKGAQLIGTDFTNAFLYGVDLSTSATQVKGTIFASAVLIGATFNGATFGPDPATGKNVRLDNAMLQGADFTNANLVGANLAGAFVDFGARTNSTNGNTVLTLLSATFNQFPATWGMPAAAKPVCVKAEYDAFTLGPSSTAGATCPNGSSYGDGCRTSPPRAQVPEARWASSLKLVQNSPPGGYAKDASYEGATPGWSSNCNGVARDFGW